MGSDSEEGFFADGYANPDDGGSGGGGHRWILMVGVFLLVLVIGGGVAAYAVDSSQKDQIADGIKIGGVDVGGQNAADAKAMLERKLVIPLNKPLRVNFDGNNWTLPAARLKVSDDIDRAIDKALAASRSGGMPNRLIRYITGEKVKKTISPDVTYSQQAVNEFVRRISGDVNRDPQNASIAATGDSLNVVPGKPGLEVRDNDLTNKLKKAAVTLTGTRSIALKTQETQPKVGTRNVAKDYPVYLTLDRANYKLSVWNDLKLTKSYTVAVGQAGLETPAGLYHIQDKQVDPVWTVPNSAWAGDMAGQVVPGGTPENPLKARWMGIFDGAGIHGTDETYSLGSAVSHGCVRMGIPDVIDLYDRVDVGTPIYIG